MNKRQKFIFAKIISRVLDVPVAVALLLYLVSNKIPLDSQIPVYMFLLGILYIVVVPVIIAVLLIKLKVLDNWELTNKSTRKYAYIVGFSSLSLTILLASWANAPLIYTRYLALGLVIVFCYGLLTEFTKYKLSIHIASWTAVIFFLTIEFSPFYILISPILILISYARIEIKNHTIPELILGGGVMLTILIFYSLLSSVLTI